ncbi:MAG TPA: hypothetical protein VK774_05925, partial [Solirubrobacteraceae bacterium]|nr:hypothetical protein [Solirubrobacteraceae bacterium]
RPFTLRTQPLPAAETGRAQAVRAILTDRARALYELGEEARSDSQLPPKEPLKRRRRHQRSAAVDGDLSADLSSDLPSA